MYNAYFGFKEKPFRLVPDPEFLFLGASHEEALAHLSFALSQAEGFVEITGEVGTGKTTLCRVFLEHLDDTVDSAFIFNSKLNASQLLSAILADLGLAVESREPSDMTRELYEFLLARKSMGRSVVLLIDEAQNLEPETLEQLRLLSNLETTKAKLLQIILVGQPELSQALNTFELRPLRQRISVSCRVLPLSAAETRLYVEHRVNTASLVPQSLFTPGALRQVFKETGGIPRKINILCDRSLLTAFGRDKKTVTRSMVCTAAKETGGIRATPSFFPFPRLAVLLLILAGVVAATLLSPRSLTHVNLKPPAAAPQPPPEPAKGFLETTAQAGDISPQAVSATPRDLCLFPRNDAFKHVLRFWEPDMDANDIHTRRLDEITADSQFFKVLAIQYGFQILHIINDPDRLLKFQLPAIIQAQMNGKPGYLVLLEIAGNGQSFVLEGRHHLRVTLPFEALARYVKSNIYIPWKDIFGYPGIITPNSPAAVIMSLKSFLRQTGFDHLALTPQYDTSLRDAVRDIQARYGLEQDGLAGPMTKIILYRLKHSRPPETQPLTP